MITPGVPFTVTDFNNIVPQNYPGTTGFAEWRTKEFINLRVRIVDYSPGYLADHWCSRGHVVFVLEGELFTELQDGRSFKMTPGMSYQVSDNDIPHRSRTETGARIYIVD